MTSRLDYEIPVSPVQSAFAAPQLRSDVTEKKIEESQQTKSTVPQRLKYDLVPIMVEPVEQKKMLTYLTIHQPELLEDCPDANSAIQYVLKQVFQETIQANYIVSNYCYESEATGNFVREFVIRSCNSNYLNRRLGNFDRQLKIHGLLNPSNVFRVKDIEIVSQSECTENERLFILNFNYLKENPKYPRKSALDEIAKIIPSYAFSEENELGLWTEYIDWKQRLAEIKVFGIKYIDYQLLEKEDGAFKFHFLAVMPDNQTCERMIKLLYREREQISVFASTISKNQWMFVFNQENKYANDLGLRLATIKRISIDKWISEGNSHALNSCWSIIKKMPDQYPEPCYADISFDIPEEYEEKFAEEKYSSDQAYAFLEKKLAKSISQDGFIATSRVGDFALNRRLKEALQSLRGGHAVASNLGHWLFDIQCAEEANVYTEIDKIEWSPWGKGRLNDSQKEVVRKMLDAPEVFLCQGPPGTGKTTVIAEAVYQFALRKKRVLIASQTNLAVNNALSKLIGYPGIRAIRLGGQGKIDSSVEHITEENILRTFYENVKMHIKQRYFQKWNEMDASVVEPKNDQLSAHKASSRKNEVLEKYAAIIDSLRYVAGQIEQYNEDYDQEDVESDLRYLQLAVTTLSGADAKDSIRISGMDCENLLMNITEPLAEVLKLGYSLIPPDIGVSGLSELSRRRKTALVHNALKLFAVVNTYRYSTTNGNSAELGNELQLLERQRNSLLNSEIDYEQLCQMMRCPFAGADNEAEWKSSVKSTLPEDGLFGSKLVRVLQSAIGYCETAITTEPVYTALYSDDKKTFDGKQVILLGASTFQIDDANSVIYLPIKLPIQNLVCFTDKKEAFGLYVKHMTVEGRAIDVFFAQSMLLSSDVLPSMIDENIDFFSRSPELLAVFSMPVFRIAKSKLNTIYLKEILQCSDLKSVVQYATRIVSAAKRIRVKPFTPVPVVKQIKKYLHYEDVEALIADLKYIYQYYLNQFDDHFLELLIDVSLEYSGSNRIESIERILSIAIKLLPRFNDAWYSAEANRRLTTILRSSDYDELYESMYSKVTDSQMHIFNAYAECLQFFDAIRSVESLIPGFAFSAQTDRDDLLTKMLECSNLVQVKHDVELMLATASKHTDSEYFKNGEIWVNAELIKDILNLFILPDGKSANIYIIDTCAFIHTPNILDYFQDSEIVRIPHTVLLELDKHKDNKSNPIHTAAAAACRSIEKHTTQAKLGDLLTFEMEPQDYPELLPIGFAYGNKDRLSPDNMILSTAFRYKAFKPTIITDDTNFRNISRSQGINAIAWNIFIDDRGGKAVRSSANKQQAAITGKNGTVAPVSIKQTEQEVIVPQRKANQNDWLSRPIADLSLPEIGVPAKVTRELAACDFPTINSLVRATDFQLKQKIKVSAVRNEAYNARDKFNSFVRHSNEQIQHSVLSKENIGQSIFFGRFQRNADLSGITAPLEWIVVDTYDGKVLLLSKDVIDSMPYKSAPTSTWENSDIREWLNSSFFSKAFTAEEQKQIVLTTIKTAYKGKEEKTQDKVFLLGVDDVKQYATLLNNELLSFPTSYAEWHGVRSDSSSGKCSWWLRSPGEKNDQTMAAVIHYNAGNTCFDIRSGFIGVRPAIWVDNGMNTEFSQKSEEIVAENATTVNIEANEDISILYEEMPAESHALEEECPQDIQIDGFSIGQTIIFGRYYQTNENDLEEIEWIVLDKEEDEYLIVSKYALDIKTFDEGRTWSNWRKSSIRQWLNDEFLNTAFTMEEQQYIRRRQIFCDASQSSPVSTMPDTFPTKDKVFLLSYSETVRYFDSDEERIAYCTPYAECVMRQNSPYVKNSVQKMLKGGCKWLLRTSGPTNSCVSCVQESGNKDSYTGVRIRKMVRPAMWIGTGNLEKDQTTASEDPKATTTGFLEYYIFSEKTSHCPFDAAALTQEAVQVEHRNGNVKKLNFQVCHVCNRLYSRNSSNTINLQDYKLIRRLLPSQIAPNQVQPYYQLKEKTKICPFDRSNLAYKVITVALINDANTTKKLDVQCCTCCGRIFIHKVSESVHLEMFALDRIDIK